MKIIYNILSGITLLVQIITFVFFLKNKDPHYMTYILLWTVIILLFSIRGKLS